MYINGGFLYPPFGYSLGGEEKFSGFEEINEGTMEPLTEMNCPACGSPALVQESVTTLRCENCNSVVQRSTSTSFLEVLGIGCYSCGAVNDKGIKYCTNCGIEVIVDCPECGNPIVLGQKKCGQCGIDILEEYINRVTNLENHIEENKKKLLNNEAIIEEYQILKSDYSSIKPIAILIILFFSLSGTLIITAIVSKITNLTLSDTILILVLVISGVPISAVVIFLVYFYLSTTAFNHNQKINHAKNEINKIDKKNILLKDEVIKYIRNFEAYKYVNT